MEVGYWSSVGSRARRPLSTDNDVIGNTTSSSMKHMGICISYEHYKIYLPWQTKGCSTGKVFHLICWPTLHFKVNIFLCTVYVALVVGNADNWFKCCGLNPYQLWGRNCLCLPVKEGIVKTYHLVRRKRKELLVLIGQRRNCENWSISSCLTSLFKSPISYSLIV